MKGVLRAKVLNGYRSHKPKGFYNLIKGHQGVDLDFRLDEDLPSPVTGYVVAIHAGPTKQVEMGNVLFIQDVFGNVHVFAHLNEIKVELGKPVKRGDIIAKTGNTGAKTTNPHLHWEIISSRPLRLIDKIMSRTLLPYKGFSTDPIIYLKDLYFKYHVDLDGNNITNI